MSPRPALLRCTLPSGVLLRRPSARSALRYGVLLPALALLAACGTPRGAVGGWTGGRAGGPRPAERPDERPLRPTLPLGPTFAENRSRLPWPADGTVTGLFGPRTEATYGTRTFSPGLDLATAPAADVRAVFDGTVSRVGVMAAYGTYVMVQHGGYTTVYGNLSATAVAAGDAVATGQVVGRAGTEDERRGAALFFALFQGDDAVDPLGWLAPR